MTEKREIDAYRQFSLDLFRFTGHGCGLRWGVSVQMPSIISCILMKPDVSQMPLGYCDLYLSITHCCTNIGSTVVMLESFTIQICCKADFVCRWSWCDWLHQQPIWHWWPQQCPVNLKWQWSGHEHQPPHPVWDGDYLGESSWKCLVLGLLFLRALNRQHELNCSWFLSSRFTFCATGSCCLWE